MKRNRPRRSTRRWSSRVTRESDALDLDKGVFSKPTAHEVALSLKKSADRSRRRKSAPLRSAMSMLTFYINRAGRKLGARRKRVLEEAKRELRKLYGAEHTREVRGSRRARPSPIHASSPSK